MQLRPRVPGPASPGGTGAGPPSKDGAAPDDGARELEARFAAQSAELTAQRAKTAELEARLAALISQGGIGAGRPSQDGAAPDRELEARFAAQDTKLEAMMQLLQGLVPGLPKAANVRPAVEAAEESKDKEPAEKADGWSTVGPTGNKPKGTTTPDQSPKPTPTSNSYAGLAVDDEEDRDEEQDASAETTHDDVPVGIAHENRKDASSDREPPDIMVTTTRFAGDGNPFAIRQIWAQRNAGRCLSIRPQRSCEKQSPWNAKSTDCNSQTRRRLRSHAWENALMLAVAEPTLLDNKKSSTPKQERHRRVHTGPRIPKAIQSRSTTDLSKSLSFPLIKAPHPKGLGFISR